MASAILYNSSKSYQNPNFTPNFTHSNFNFTTFQNPNFTHFNHISRPPHHFPPPEKPTTHIFQQPHHPPPPEKPIFRRGTKSDGRCYITFRLASFSKRELKDLKKRLVSDLHRVRILRQRVEQDLTVPKRPLPLPLPLPKETTKKQKVTVKKNVGKKSGKKGKKYNDDVAMKNCKQILGKLMKSKNGWVFNKPVDTVGMKLFDYNQIIKNPMDLGTIKKKIEKNEYNNDSFEFANDVRLTFNNAMLYNGKGSEVYVMAERLLLLFEGLFSGENVKKKSNEKVNVKVEKAVEVVRNVGEKMNKKKREMTCEEKEKLAESLLSMDLENDGMDELVKILKGKALGLKRFGNEIELDIGVIDDDTLWKLRSFVDAKKKILQADDCVVSEPNEVMEEDVDIGEEIQLTNYKSVEIEKDSSSSSSSESDSSSSGSSSDCSSGSGGEEQEANSTQNN
uniref:transcription factor GTE7-like n=1 Tax=Erigeron canadensis TaxID=72917 RepID=UPI001CB9478B|nr:transcription factor GTE7-like [Erigeron canadensis]